MITAVTSCKQVTIVNGELPAEYIELAKIYMTSYHGSFNSNAGDLHLSLNGKKIVVSFTGDVNDITGDEYCDSKMGDLKMLQVNDQGTMIEAASFAFDPGRCSEISGRSFDLTFSQDPKKLQAQAVILKEIRPIQVCVVTGPPNPVQICHIDYQNYYMGGVFSK